MFVFACRTDRGIYFQEARLHRDPSGPRNYSAYESTRKMEGDESRLTFESPNLFGGRERKCSNVQNGKWTKGRRTRRDFEFHRKEATERVTRSSMETGFSNLAFHFQIPGIPEPRDTDYDDISLRNTFNGQVIEKEI